MSLFDNAAALVERLDDDPVNKISLVATGFSAAVVPLALLVTGEYVNGLVSACFAVVMTIVFRWTIVRARQPLEPTTIFTGVRPPQGDEVWRRDEIALQLVARFDVPPRTPTFVTGLSGSGKSTLLRDGVGRIIAAKGWRVQTISEYDDLVARVRRELKTSIRYSDAALERLDFDPDDVFEDRGPVLVILDQLERIEREPTHVQKWLGQFVEQILENPNVRVVAIVRREFFYDIRELGPFVPSPYFLFEVPGMEPDGDGEARSAAKNALSKVATDDVVSTVFKQLAARLPIEIQMCGELLEREWRKNHRERIDAEAYARLGGTRRALLAKYFEYYVHASPAPQLTPAVLYALAVAGSPRSLSVADIARVTYSTPKRVEAIVKYLMRHSLVVTSDQNHFHLAHDAIAELYRDVAARDVSMEQRDAITFAVEHPQSVVRPASSPPVRRSDVGATAIFLLMVLAIGLRIGKSVIDPDGIVSYAMVAPAHVAWAFFMYRLTRNVFVRLPGWQVSLWLIFAVLGAASLALTMWKPELWILSMGLTGSAVGIAFFFVSLEPRLAEIAIKSLRAVAANFVLVGATMILGGFAFYAVVLQCANVQRYVPTATFAASLGFVLLSVSSSSKYVGEGAAKAWLGLIDRV